MDDQLYCLGGGMNCFGFGTTFSVPMQLDLSPLLQQCERSFSQSHMLSHLNKSNAQMGKSNPPLGKFTSQGEKSTPPRQQAALLSDCSVGKHKVQVVSTGTASFSESSLHPLTVFRNTDNALDLSSQPEASTQGVSTAGVPTAVEDAPTFPSQPTASGDSHAGQIRMAFAICKAQAKSAKDSLRAVGWLDRSCKAHADALGNICLPITEVGSQQLASYQPYAPCGPDSQTNVPLQNGHAPTAQLSASSQQSSYVSVSDQHPSTAQSHTQPDVLNTNGMYIESTTCAQPHPREQRCVNGNTKHVQGSPGQQHMRCLKHMLANGSAKLQPLDAVIPARAGVGPAAKLRQQIQELLEQQVSHPPLAKTA